MGNFNRDGGRNFGKGGGNRPMFKATCSKCGNECEVPFRPTGDRPVFCNNCFKAQGGNAGGGRPERSFGGNRPKFTPSHNAGGNNNSGQFKAQFDILNAKLDNILKTLTPAPATAKTKTAAKKPAKKVVVKKKK